MTSYHSGALLKPPISLADLTVEADSILSAVQQPTCVGMSPSNSRRTPSPNSEGSVNSAEHLSPPMQGLKGVADTAEEPQKLANSIPSLTVAADESPKIPSLVCSREDVVSPKISAGLLDSLSMRNAGADPSPNIVGNSLLGLEFVASSTQAEPEESLKAIYHARLAESEDEGWSHVHRQGGLGSPHSPIRGSFDSEAAIAEDLQPATGVHDSSINLQAFDMESPTNDKTSPTKDKASLFNEKLSETTLESVTEANDEGTSDHSSADHAAAAGARNLALTGLRPEEVNSPEKLLTPRRMLQLDDNNDVDDHIIHGNVSDENKHSLEDCKALDTSNASALDGTSQDSSLQISRPDVLGKDFAGISSVGNILCNDKAESSFNTEPHDGASSGKDSYAPNHQAGKDQPGIDSLSEAVEAHAAVSLDLPGGYSERAGSDKEKTGSPSVTSNGEHVPGDASADEASTEHLDGGCPIPAEPKV